MPSRKKSKSRAKPKQVTKRGVKAKSPKGPAKKKLPRKKASKAQARRTKRSVGAAAELKREFQSRDRRSGLRSSPQQSEDFEGLSRAEQADSESVDELVEEGNVFEAGAVAGVEQADDSDEREVHTNELPEDDVPEEYQNKD